MPLLLVLTAAGAWLLLGAGLMKLRDPDGTGQAITVLTGGGATQSKVRLLGLAEITVSVAFLSWPHALTALGLGTAYLLVLGSAWILRTREADCGCFGSASSKVGIAHIVITLVAALSGLGLTVLGSLSQVAESYAVIVSAIPVALGAYALIAPMTQLKSELADLRA